MHIRAHLDVDMVAVETGDDVSVLIELTAPTAPAPGDATSRPVRTLQVVLDRSGSMNGGRLDGAITALNRLIDRLDPTDNFGVVAFDDRVELTAPAGPLTDKQGLTRAIAALRARGSTDLSAGYLRGIQEARRVAGPAGATVLVITDGHANQGITDPERLREVAMEANSHRITTSVLGYGLGYDERLVSAIAKGGTGNELFAEEPDTAIALISGELDGLLTQTAQAASLLIRPSNAVQGVAVLNDLPTASAGDAVIAELGSFYAGESRKLVLAFHVPAMAALGLTEIATLELTYVELPALEQHTITVSMHVNVVPGDQAAGRVPDPVVRTEALYQRVQHAKRRASELFSAGDPQAAIAEVRKTQAVVQGALSAELPEPLASDLAKEVASLEYTVREATRGSTDRANKFLSMDSRYNSGLRGRERPQHTQAPIDWSEEQ